MNDLAAIKKAVKSFIGFSLPTWINALIGVVAVPLVTRLFEPEILGKYNLFHTYGTIFFSITLAGLNQGLMRFYNEPPGKNTTGGLYKLTMTIAVCTTILTTLFILAFWRNLSSAISGEPNYYIILCLVVYIATSTFLYLINASYRMQDSLLAYGVLTILMNISSKITYVGAAFTDEKLLSAITLLTGSYLVITLVYLFRDLINFKDEKVLFGKEEIIPLLKYSLPLLPVMFISQINTALPKLVIGEYLTYSQVGIYTSAYSIVSIIAIMQSGINVFWAPFVFRNYIEHPTYLTSGHLFITFSMTVFGLLMVLFQDIIYLLIGPAYHESQTFFALLLISPIYYTISETTGIGINISKKTYLNFVVYGVTISITFLFCFFLIPLLGLIGAALSVAIASLSLLVVKTMIGERFYKIVTSPLKTISAPVIFFVDALLSTVFFNSFWLRTFINLTAIFTICIIYRKEIRSLLVLLVVIVNKRKSGE